MHTYTGILTESDTHTHTHDCLVEGRAETFSTLEIT